MLNKLQKMMRIGRFSFFALCLSTGIASAATLDFTSVDSGNVASFTEDGFAVTTVDFRTSGFGNPEPSLLSTIANATVTIMVDGGGLFNFAAFDLADGGGGGSDGVTVEGFLLGASQFASFFAPMDSFTNTLSPSAVNIDTLVFTTAPSGGFLNLDNIEVSPSTAVVPLPAALPLLLGGLGIIGLIGRRKERRDVVTT